MPYQIEIVYASDIFHFRVMDYLSLAEALLGLTTDDILHMSLSALGSIEESACCLTFIYIRHWDIL